MRQNYLISKLIQLIEIGLCNSIMGWKDESTNHFKAVSLINLSLGFYLWTTIILISQSTDTTLPMDGLTKYLVPGLCMIIAGVIAWGSFKNMDAYKSTKDWYKLLSSSKSWLINLFAVLFVFASIPLLVNSIAL